MKSTKFTITKHDIIKVAKGAGIAMAGALALYLAGVLELIDWSTVGQYGFLLSPLASIVINFLRKFATETPTEIQ